MKNRCIWCVKEPWFDCQFFDEGSCCISSDDIQDKFPIERKEDEIDGKTL